MSVEEIVVGYRFVTEDLRSENGDLQWRMGEWQRVEGPLKLCENGLHSCREPLDSLSYVFGSRWMKSETRGERMEDDDKFCGREMRLINEIPITVIVQFAVDCAKRVLPVYEESFPNDSRPRKAVEATEEWLRKPTAAAETVAGAAAWAAWAAAEAAWAAAEAAEAAWAAGKAAGAAAWAAEAAEAAWATAWATARAARKAAGAAAWAAWAAGDVEREWQREHLKKLVQEALQ